MWRSQVSTHTEVCHGIIIRRYQLKKLFFVDFPCEVVLFQGEVDSEDELPDDDDESVYCAEGCTMPEPVESQDEDDDDPYLKPPPAQVCEDDDGPSRRDSDPVVVLRGPVTCWGHRRDERRVLLRLAASVASMHPAYFYSKSERSQTLVAVTAMATIKAPFYVSMLPPSLRSVLLAAYTRIVKAKHAEVNPAVQWVSLVTKPDTHMKVLRGLVKDLGCVEYPTWTPSTHHTFSANLNDAFSDLLLALQRLQRRGDVVCVGTAVLEGMLAFYQRKHDAK